MKKDAIVIDVGSNFKDNKAYGDVQYEEAAKIASAITPVPVAWVPSQRPRSLNKSQMPPNGYNRNEGFQW